MLDPILNTHIPLFSSSLSLPLSRCPAPAGKRTLASDQGTVKKMVALCNIKVIAIDRLIFPTIPAFGRFNPLAGAGSADQILHRLLIFVRRVRLQDALAVLVRKVFAVGFLQAQLKVGDPALLHCSILLCV